MHPTLAGPAGTRQAICAERTPRSGNLSPVARVFVDVMPKPEILDPQGQAVARALPRLGFQGVADVRQGKHFELEVDDSVDDETLAKIAEGFLSNPVIEDFVVRRAQ
jgi:phosphoribosylformylglycinamidine synthase subunit PurS